jgi:hypothetical protein
VSEITPDDMLRAQVTLVHLDRQETTGGETLVLARAFAEVREQARALERARGDKYRDWLVKVQGGACSCGEPVAHAGSEKCP